MFKSILSILCASLSALMLPGCFGGVVFYPDECKNETPTANMRDLRPFVFDENRFAAEPFIKTSKADFKESWGKPDKINSISENTETWIYERHFLWCGVVPIFFIPIPLLVPLCHGFERIDFQGDEAKRIYIRRMLMSGVFVTHPQIGKDFFDKDFGIIGRHDPACRNPLPDNDAGPDATKSDVHTPP